MTRMRQCMPRPFHVKCTHGSLRPPQNTRCAEWRSVRIRIEGRDGRRARSAIRGELQQHESREHAASCSARSVSGHIFPRRHVLGAGMATALTIMGGVTCPPAAFALKQLELKDGQTLTVYEHGMSLKIIGLRGSVPAQWIVEFQQTLGRYAGFAIGQRTQISEIFQELVDQDKSDNSSAKADVVTLGDAWLGLCIQRGLVQPIPHAETARWWQLLPQHWQTLVKRNVHGQLDPEGQVWGCPYRWGCTVIAYRKDLLVHYGGRPVEDWADLLQPKLKHKVGFLESPREFVGAALKSLGWSYNTTASQLRGVPGASEQLKERVQQFYHQARVFSDKEHVRALGAGDAWAIVGWSCDLLPLTEKSSNVVVVAPRSGTALWADLWVVPRGAEGGSKKQGPSPILPAWLQFNLMPARAITLPGLKTGAIPALLPAPRPAALEAPDPADGEIEDGSDVDASSETWRLQKKDNFLPAKSILERSEFMYPLDYDTIELYKSLYAKGS